MPAWQLGYTFFTIDPGEHVDNRAETASLSELRELAEALPVEVIQPAQPAWLGKIVRPLRASRSTSTSRPCSKRRSNMAGRLRMCAACTSI